MTFVKEISFAVAGVLWLLFHRSLYGDRHEIMQQPVLDLIKWPNPLQGKFVWIAATVRFLYFFLRILKELGNLSLDQANCLKEG
jgi:hypothetical protein